jgi:hypothetical protein
MLTKKIEKLDKLQQGKLASTVAYKYGINESTIRYTQKKDSENKVIC